MFRQVLVVLFTVALFCPSAFAVTEQEMSHKVFAAAQKAAAAASSSSKDSMKDNMLLTVSFSERGMRNAENEVMDTSVTLQGPDWTVPEMEEGYAFNRFFVYEALPKEIDEGLAENEDGKYIFYSEELIPNRKLLRAFAVYTGVKKTPRYEGRIGCKAYALAPQWVITAGTCPITQYDETPMGIYDETYDQRTDRQIEEFRLDGALIKDPRYFSNGKVWLVYIPQKDNQALISQLSAKRPLNLLGFTEPENIFSLTAFAPFYVHTSRYGLLVGDKTKARLKTASLNGLQFEASSSFNGTATDPLFYVVNGEEYLTAYSAAPEKYHLNISNDVLFQSQWSGKASNKYTLLQESDLQFIKNTVRKQDPNSWGKIKYRLFVDKPGQLLK